MTMTTDTLALIVICAIVCALLAVWFYAIAVAGGRADDAAEALCRAGYLTVDDGDPAEIEHRDPDCTGRWNVDEARGVACTRCEARYPYTAVRARRARAENALVEAVQCASIRGGRLLRIERERAAGDTGRTS